MGLLLLIIYLWLGCKSINYIKIHLLGMSYLEITTASNFIFSKILFALFLGWITIPLWLVLSLLGIGKN